MAQAEHIVHSIPPTYDERSRVLVLGSLPSPRSREAGFNYGHPHNRFWRVMAALSDEPVPTTTERRRDFCLRHHIALWDVVAEADVEGASDASIRNAKPNPLTQITQAAPIEAVFCTGAKSYDLYRKLCEADVGMPAVKLPSTSPANAACSFDALVEAYAGIFRHEHAFEPPTLDIPQVVALEQAIAEAGTPLIELMDRAGAALARRMELLMDQMRAGTFRHAPAVASNDAPPHSSRNAIAPSASPLAVILCGSGNNGGDGWVAARLLAQAGHAVCVVTKRPAEDVTAQPAHDAALDAAEKLTGLGANVLFAGEPLPLDSGDRLVEAPLILVNPDQGQLDAVMARAAIVADAILGTGASGSSVREPYRSWIEAANAARAHAAIIAADIPTGVSAADGAVADAHTHADETVTMIVPKPGLTSPACGTVSVAPLAYIEPYLPRITSAR
jgi:hypoxanthine-DNA glycosylase